MRFAPSGSEFAFAQSFVNVRLIAIRRNLSLEALTKGQRVTADFIARDDAASDFGRFNVWLNFSDYRPGSPDIRFASTFEPTASVDAFFGENRYFLCPVGQIGQAPQSLFRDFA